VFESPGLSNLEVDLAVQPSFPINTTKLDSEDSFEVAKEAGKHQRMKYSTMCNLQSHNICQVD